MKVETYLPVFSGFNGTFFEADVEGEIDHINEEREQLGLNAVDENDIHFDYAAADEITAKLACQYVHNTLDFVNGVKFQEVISPREYNFTNDSINCEIDLNVKDMLNYLDDHREEFTEYLKEKYTSYDGFISFHSNDVNDWTWEYIKAEASHRIGACLTFIMFNEDEDAEDAMYDYVRANGGCWAEATNYDELINKEN